MTDEFQIVVHTLRELDETEYCRTVHGYFVLLTEFRFLSTLYVLFDVLPILACLSKTFQEGKFNFSQIKPTLVRDSTPVVKLENGIEKEKYAEISKKPTDGKLQKARQLLSKYVNSLTRNIDKRLSDCLSAVNALVSLILLMHPIQPTLILRSMAPATLMCLQIIFIRMIS